MELPHIFRFKAGHQPFLKRRVFKQRGFTLIETVIVVAIIAIVATASVAFSLPALGNFGCLEEEEVARIALERARHASQYARLGRINVEIKDSGYEIIAQGRDGQHPMKIDEYRHRSPIPVMANRSITFFQNVGAPIFNTEVVIGGGSSTCHQIININNAGAIL